MEFEKEERMKELMVMFEKYYELKYNDFEVKFLEDYLEGKEKMFPILFKNVIEKHEKRWRSLPDIAMLDKEIKEIIKDQKKIIEEIRRRISRGYYENSNLLFSKILRCKRWQEEEKSG